MPRYRRQDIYWGCAHRTGKSVNPRNILSARSRSTEASGGVGSTSKGLRIRGADGVIPHTGVKPKNLELQWKGAGKE